MGYLETLLWMLGFAVLTKLWEAFVVIVWRPYTLTRRMEKQGVRGPPYKFIKGSFEEIRSMRESGRSLILDTKSHDFIPKVLPHFRRWIPEYGNTFLYWMGTHPRICIMDAELAKQILLVKFGFYEKVKHSAPLLALLGKGLALLDGSDWARHRRIINQAFTTDKLKGMANAMAACTLSMLDGLQKRVNESESQLAQIDMENEFLELTANVISHTAFGQSYAEGKLVFEAQKELQTMAAASFMTVRLPGFQYLPTRTNRKSWALEKTIKGILTRIIENRLDHKHSDYGKDLLGLMLEACRSETNNRGKMMLTMDEIIDECRTFFFAGHETTSHVLTWTVFLLASNQGWQERLRDEVLNVCGTALPDAECVGKLKLVQMVLLETLRLYAPASAITRRAIKDMRLGSLDIPKHSGVVIPIALIHRSKDIWGEDANEFNPWRFENGISKAANHPNAFIAFSLGPRVCIGQHFAMLEAKIAVAMILQRFSFSLSPEYKHAPIDILTLQPQFGLPIILTSLTK